jgi:transcriptional regulator with GAF, ATPase, and Fis domain
MKDSPEKIMGLLILTKNERSRMIGNIIGHSSEIKKLQDTVIRVASSKATVLITGETGTGKEMIAQAIHFNSPRKNGPFVKINCAALTESLLESELFGYEKGAFTGASQITEGIFVQADGGSILLDEVDEMSTAMQSKLLRVLQEKELRRVGGNKTVKFDVRVISATNKDLATCIKTGTFRKDLYQRLNTVTLNVPPLNKRKEDICDIANHYLKCFSEDNDKSIVGFTSSAMDKLEGRDWTDGNVRELMNTIERSVVFSQSDQINEHEILFTEKSITALVPQIRDLPTNGSDPSNAHKFLEFCNLLLKENNDFSNKNLSAFLKRIANPLNIWPTDRHGVCTLGRELLKAVTNYRELFHSLKKSEVEKIFNCLMQNVAFKKENEGDIQKLLIAWEIQSLPIQMLKPLKHEKKRQTNLQGF